MASARPSVARIQGAGVSVHAELKAAVSADSTRSARVEERAGHRIRREKTSLAAGRHPDLPRKCECHPNLTPAPADPPAPNPTCALSACANSRCAEIRWKVLLAAATEVRFHLTSPLIHVTTAHRTRISPPQRLGERLGHSCSRHGRGTPGALRPPLQALNVDPPPVLGHGSVSHQHGTNEEKQKEDSGEGAHHRLPPECTAIRPPAPRRAKAASAAKAGGTFIPGGHRASR
jgi:hypothetical protein